MSKKSSIEYRREYQRKYYRTHLGKTRLGLMPNAYKGIRDKKGIPIRLLEIVSLYRVLDRKFGRASCNLVAAQLTTMGYKSKLGGPINGNQIFRAMMRSSDGPPLLKATRERIGR